MVKATFRIVDFIEWIIAAEFRELYRLVYAFYHSLNSLMS